MKVVKRYEIAGLPEMIKRTRKKKNIPPATIAQQVDISLPYYYKIESGKVTWISDELYLKLMDAIDVTPLPFLVY